MTTWGHGVPCGRFALAAAAALMCGGCGPKDYDTLARKLVVPAALPGQVMLAFTGTGEQMIQRGRINEHRRIEGAAGCDIDVWVIHSRQVDPAEAARRVVRGTVVLLHPLLLSKSWWLETGEALAARGWDVVLPDLRAHGRSEGQYVTWGYREKRDIRAVMDALLATGRPREGIYVVGASLGGAVAIQYAAIDPRVRGVLVFAPPKSMREIGRRILLLESEADYETALRRAQEMAGIPAGQASTLAAAQDLRCPLRIAHGMWDFVVPYDHSQAIYEAAAGPKEFLSIGGAGHAAEIGRKAWICEQVDALAEMSAEGE